MRSNSIPVDVLFFFPGVGRLPISTARNWAKPTLIAWEFQGQFPLKKFRASSALGDLEKEAEISIIQKKRDIFAGTWENKTLGP